MTVSTDENGEPFEVFGSIGKAGSFISGVTELACRLISLHLRRGTPLYRSRSCSPSPSLHLRRGTPLAEVVEQTQGIQEMQPFANVLPDRTSIWVRGLGDGIAHILRGFL